MNETGFDRYNHMYGNLPVGDGWSNMSMGSDMGRFYMGQWLEGHGYLQPGQGGTYDVHRGYQHSFPLRSIAPLFIEGMRMGGMQMDRFYLGWQFAPGHPNYPRGGYNPLN